ncbi:hypothetical protein [Chryseobacterium luteum]|uniref:Sugar-binding protein n=1 Tax=Chryseobacterium luteum TaxID=421531 RepID=A0A085ZW11_9FLAO|nr:hypothetical protein [Chryseobacterium luteum]KFF08625.1 hypothetical protein IX38_04025 [Chryseobacterium luteum]
MKKLITKLNYLFILIGFFGSAQNYIVENEKLKGNIKSIDLFIIEHGNKEKPVDLQTFDSKGRPLIVKKYNDGYLRSEERNEYLPNQIITTLCQSCGDNFDSYFSKFSIKENQKHPYSGYGTNDPSVKRKIFKTTDKKGNVVLAKYYNVEGYLISITKSTYNAQSKLLSRESSDDENKLLSNSKYIYNKNNSVIEEISKSETQPELKMNYFYDNLGRIKLEKQNYNNSLYETSYEYAKVKDTAKILKYSASPPKEKKLYQIELTYPKQKGKIIEKQNVSDNKVGYKTVYEYDESQKLVVQKYYDDKSELISESHYFYDKNGNWNEINTSETISVIYNNDAPKKENQKKKYIRKIEYY